MQTKLAIDNIVSVLEQWSSDSILDNLTAVLTEIIVSAVMQEEALHR